MQQECALFVETIPSVKQKVMIDVINCIDVANDHNRLLRNLEGSIVDRIFSTVTGNTLKSTNLTLQNHGSAIEALTQLVEDLGDRQQRSLLALQNVANRVNVIENTLAITIEKIGLLNRKLEDFKKLVHRDMLQMQQMIGNMKLRMDAVEQVDMVMTKWKAGDYNNFPLGSRIYVVLYDLYWGSFGDYVRYGDDQDNIKNQIINLKKKMETQIKEDSFSTDFLPIEHWVRQKDNPDTTAEFFIDGLKYLGSDVNKDHHPWSYAMSKLPSMESLPSDVSLYFGPNLIMNRMVREFFFKPRVNFNA